MNKNSLLSPRDEETVGVETGLDALRESPTFRGPVEPHDDDRESNDHLALLYETTAEQFGAAIPFIRQGLERGERCLYVADENSRDEVLDAMRAADFDADAARESGALTLHTSQDTYCRNGGFDPDETVEFLAEQIEAAREEYSALRIAAEMTWIFGADPEIDALIEYEEKVNRLLGSENSIALCQYNRDRFPADALADVVRAHPHLVYEQTVCQNYYYTPPEEFFGPDQPEREVERMVETLRERTEATVRLRDRERQLRRQNDRLESFATLVAHELRNPVAIGQIYSQQLPEAADADSVEHVADAFDRIEDMVDILLVVTRGRDAVTDETSVRLDDAVHAAWAKSETDAATLDVAVSGTIRTDETYLEHLFRNLFENAVEHGDADTVTVGDLPTGFYVADDGSGIPVEARERVFDVGYTTAADHGGTGVGLAFVSALADVYGWEYSVTESEAGGARFEFENVTRA
ncbi:MEDS domain-containing protein [Halorussus sp. AFM4]|uniref:MEDS domain-containing protein n=1 Tax=Halorussus sp. AFM4 TaxID=3421651 RepID=UPI003EBF92E2